MAEQVNFLHQCQHYRNRNAHQNILADQWIANTAGDQAVPGDEGSEGVKTHRSNTLEEIKNEKAIYGDVQRARRRVIAHGRPISTLYVTAINSGKGFMIQGNTSTESDLTSNQSALGVDTSVRTLPAPSSGG